MFNEFTHALEQTIQIMQANAFMALKIIALLWVIHFINYALHYRLNVLGILPRHPFGLIGIVTSPFLHGHFNHLFFNSIPLFLLLPLVLAPGFHAFLLITANIFLLGGLATWLFGRKAMHVGASGVIMGYLGFLLMQAWHQRSASALIVGAIALYYCSSLLLSLIPQDEKTSFEGHIFGFAAGIATAYGWMIV